MSKSALYAHYAQYMPTDFFLKMPDCHVTLTSDIIFFTGFFSSNMTSLGNSHVEFV